MNRDMEGVVGRVLLPVEKGSDGKIRVAVKGILKDLRAYTDDAEPISIGEEVLVVRVSKDRAKVTGMGKPKALKEKNQGQ